MMQRLHWYLNFCVALLGLASPLAAQYCTPQYNFVDCNTLQRRLYITSVQLNNRTFSTYCSSAGYAGIVNSNDPIVLTGDRSYNMTVNTVDYDSRTYTAVSNQANRAVWIDFNNNGVFDTYELVSSGTSPNFSIYAYSNQGGNYRMRIRVRAISATDDPCMVQDYGETEDYTIRVIPSTPTVTSSQYVYPCSNSSFTLSASGCPSGTIQWRDQNDSFVGNNPASVQTAQNRSYYAACVVNGTASLPSGRVYAYPSVIAPPSVSSNNYNLTVGQSAALTATGCQYGTVTWSTGQTGSSITVAPTQNTTYSATCSSYSYNYCTSNKSNEITVAVNAPSAPSISASKNVVCPNESVTLTAGNCAGTVKWSTGALGTPSVIVTPTQQTSYSASCVINNVEGAKATTTISVNPTTAIATQPNQAIACEGSQATFGVSATGSGNLTYAWSRNGVALTDSSAATSQLILRNLTAASDGSYQVRVTGACGVAQSNSVALQVSTKMTAIAASTPATCSGDANGSIAVSTTGGLGDKQFRLSDQINFTPSASLTSLRAGTYTVQVRDVAGCQAQTSVEVKQPDPIAIKSTAPTAAKCAGGSDGAVDVEATGGNGGYQYSINDGSLRSSGQFRDLKANTNYVVRTVDVKGCSATTNVLIGAPNQLVVNAVPKSVSCAGGNTGSISVTASGGTGSYTYQLNQSNSQPGNTFGSLVANTYTITVKDALGCEGKTDVTVNQPTPVSVTAIATLVSCRSDTSASIIAAAVGGAGQYAYSANARPFSLGNTLRSVGVGSYTVTAVDGNGCSASTTVAVVKAEPLLLQAVTQAASCCNCPNGVVSLTSSGGIGQKQYQFGQTEFQTGNTFRNITSGRYGLSVRDESGCVTSLSATVSNATAATLTLGSTKNVSCAGGRDGSATVLVNGESRPYGYSYTWQAKNSSDSLGTGNNVTRLPEGEFTVIVTDTSNRCTVPISGTLTAVNPLPPKPTITPSGGNLIASAQSGVQWYMGANLTTGKPVPNATQSTFTPFNSEPYFVIVTANGCASLPSDVFAFILTAIEPTLPLTLRVMPNPISGQLRIEVEQPVRTMLLVKLIDQNGRTILNERTPAFSGKQQFTWPLPNAGAGVYLLQAEAGPRRSTQRIVVH